MKIRFLLSALLVSLIPVTGAALSSSSTPSSSILPNTSQCLTEIFANLARQQRFHRLVLFGQSPSALAGENAMRYDRDGDPWMKHGGMWKTLAKGKEASPLSDAAMDSALESDPFWSSPIRRGILETRTHLTSELLPDLLQSLRALRCRVRSVCLAERRSESPEDPTIGSSVDGCLPFAGFEFLPFPSCRFTGQSGNLQATEVRGICDSSAATIIQRETHMLELLVSYDSATRTLLQFSGPFERFATSFSLRVFTPLRQVASLLQYLTRTPCFLSRCDL